MFYRIQCTWLRWQKFECDSRSRHILKELMTVMCAVIIKNNHCLVQRALILQNEFFQESYYASCISSTEQLEVTLEWPAPNQAHHSHWFPSTGLHSHWNGLEPRLPGPVFREPCMQAWLVHVQYVLTFLIQLPDWQTKSFLLLLYWLRILGFVDEVDISSSERDRMTAIETSQSRFADSDAITQTNVFYSFL